MPSRAFRNTVAIAGVGETDYSRNSGRTELALALEAIQAALVDAGIEPREVDGLMKWRVDTSAEADVAANLGIPDLAWWGEISQAGNVGAALVAHAAAAIHARLANVVVIYRGVNGRSGRRYGRGDVTGQRGQGGGAFTEPYGLLTPQHGLAMAARRRMFETGITSRQFGTQAVAQRRHANRNPRATFYDRPLTWRSIRHRGLSSILSICSTAAWRPTAAAPSCLPAPTEYAPAADPCRSSAPLRKQALARPTGQARRQAPVRHGRNRPQRHRRGADLRSLLPVRAVRLGGLRLRRRRWRFGRRRRHCLGQRPGAREHLRRPPLGSLHAGHEPPDRSHAANPRRIDRASAERGGSPSATPASAPVP